MKEVPIMSIDLQSKSLDWFYMIGTSVMKELKVVNGRFNMAVVPTEVKNDSNMEVTSLPYFHFPSSRRRCL